MRCLAKWCRFPTSHVTSAHRCGKCGKFGHGLVECGDGSAIYELQMEGMGDAMPDEMRCELPGCLRPWSHTTAAHHCPNCGVRGGSHKHTARRQASCAEITVDCPQCRMRVCVDPTRTVFTGAACAICDEAGPMVVFECRHAQTCPKCVARL